MKISEVDKNLVINTSIDKKDIVWLCSDKAPFEVYGAIETNPFKRIPTDIAKQTNAGVEILYTNTAGVRLRFRTNSPYLAIHVEWDEQIKFPHMPTTGVCCFDLYEYSKFSNCQKFIHPMASLVDAENGFDGLCELSGEMTDYVLNFPLYNNVNKLYIGVSDTAEFQEPAKYINNLPVVFYGSSITQGACASRPGSSYENIISRRFNLDYINLGFSGNGMAEDAIVDYMSKLDMFAFVSDYDHNAPDIDHLEKTHYKMYKIIRDYHPDIPYIMITRPDYGFNEHCDKRRTIVMKSFIKAIESGDRNVYFIDGASIFSGDEFDSCTVDGCHPTDLGFSQFAERLIPTFKTIIFK